MKRMLGFKKKRRSTGHDGRDGGGLPGHQDIGGIQPSASGSGSSAHRLGLSGSRSSTSSTKYQYAIRHYQEAAEPFTGETDYNAYENPMNDAHVRLNYAGSSADGGSGSGGSIAESSLRRRTQEKNPNAATTTASGAAAGAMGNGIIAGGSSVSAAPTFETLASIEEGGGEGIEGVSSRISVQFSNDEEPSPSASSFQQSPSFPANQQQQGYSPPTDGKGQSPHDAPPPSNNSFDDQFTYTSVGGTGAASPPEPQMPDVTYEEYYGDAYVGKPIKYIYPAGYQSMRPRSRPWKLSIFIFCLFTWLTVFIVGHCSDEASDQYGYLDDAIDDDAVVIETRWCGSRMLYFMWVMSVLITGLACAYCSIIGYIQVRDFSIANGRAQPPVVTGRSDYYVNIDDGNGGDGRHPPPSSSGRSGYGSYQDGHAGSTIYQADGTPQFWGSHIYKPTQAAVAVTSR